jgi:hypothetical protein
MDESSFVNARPLVTARPTRGPSCARPAMMRQTGTCKRHAGAPSPGRTLGRTVSCSRRTIPLG